PLPRVDPEPLDDPLVALETKADPLAAVLLDGDLVDVVIVAKARQHRLERARISAAVAKALVKLDLADQPERPHIKRHRVSEHGSVRLANGNRRIVPQT